MAVADLHEPKAVGTSAFRHGGTASLPERQSFEHTARHRPRGTSADPRHALQKPATIHADLVILLRHTRLLH
jgi:hypothetical protein